MVQFHTMVDKHKNEYCNLVNKTVNVSREMIDVRELGDAGRKVVPGLLYCSESICEKRGNTGCLLVKYNSTATF